MITEDDLALRWRGIGSMRTIPYDEDELRAGLIGLRAAGLTGPDSMLVPFVAGVLDAVRAYRETS